MIKYEIYKKLSQRKEMNKSTRILFYTLTQKVSILKQKNEQQIFNKHRLIINHLKGKYHKIPFVL